MTKMYQPKLYYASDNAKRVKSNLKKLSLKKL